MVKWATARGVTATTASMKKTSRSFLAIVIVIASLVRATNGLLPTRQNTAAASSQADSGTDARKLFGGYRITPKHCRATKTLPVDDPRVNGPTICMFNHECAQRNGEVVGACMDGFLFGACCQIPLFQQVQSTLINDAQAAYFQQYEQHKLHEEQSLSNPVAQSYENYAAVVSNEQQQTTSHGSSHRPDAPTMSNYSTYFPSTTHQKHPSTEKISPSSHQPSSAAQSVGSGGKSPFTKNTGNTRPVNFKATTPGNQPPRVHDTKISSSSSSSSSSSQSHNDDFVMQALSTLPPDRENGLIKYATEVPTKISTHPGTVNRFSSESNSFEEEPSVTQLPVPLIVNPTRQKPTKQQGSPHKKPQKQNRPQQQQQTTNKQPLKNPQKPRPQRPTSNQQYQPSPNQQHPTSTIKKHQTLPTNQQYQSNANHKNDLIVDANEFTHSGITHPGADTDIVDDLQFSTGYGPQPVIVQSPVSSNIKPPQPDEKYVLVQTISNDQTHKQPSPSGSATTSSAITTHVDSIESIILQLNNSNHGPVYSVVNHADQSYSPSSTHSIHGGSSTSTAADKQPTHSESSTFPTTDRVKPLQTAPTEVAVTSFQEIDTKRPEDYQQENYASMTSQLPAYLEPVKSNLNYNYAAESNKYGSSSNRPQEASPTTTYTDESSATLNDAAMPNNNYNDMADAVHQTSSFNKRPAMGIAYPVDMSLVDEEGNLVTENEFSHPQSSSQKPMQSSAVSSAYTGEPAQTVTPNESIYTKMPSASGTTTNNHPMGPQIGVVTAPSYIQQSTDSTYNHLPAEVSVTSHTTKVHDSADKLTTITYVETPVATSNPSNVRPTNFPYATSQSILDSKLPYEGLMQSSSSARPKPSKRPGLGNTKKTSKPQGQKRPSTFTQTQAYGPYQPTTNKSPLTPLTEKYNTRPVDTVTTFRVPNTPSGSYNQQQQHVSSPPYNPPTSRKPITNKKPISNSYISGPTPSRPPTTSAYDNEVPPLIIADDKLDSFPHSTAASSAVMHNNYQAPVYASAVSPIEVQSAYNENKRPGYIKIRPNPNPPPPMPSAINTPKPPNNAFVKQPSSADFYEMTRQPTTTPLPAFASTSYIFSPSITRRPEYTENTSEYVSLPPMNSNDFYDPGYYGNQQVTNPTYAIPSDDRPAFPGYYGPTPSYPAFPIPGEKNEGSIEETYTSPNDFVNFPPVRNPNLNMSASSSAVTSDLELSTPAFVEDGVLKDKMNTLVHKIVESLQGNFEALADIIDESEPATFQAPTGGITTTATRKPTRKPVTTKPKATTKKPITRLSTRQPTKKSTTTRKSATRRTTRKPSTTRRPTKRPTSTTTNAAPFQDEFIDEEDGEDVNLVNEIGDSDTGGFGAGGRKIQCGVRPHVKSGRIVGGKGSTFGAFPWQVLVRESTWLGLFTKNKCGGVLITNKYVITAAHCQPGFLASLVAVMGEFDISGDLESKKSVTKNVKRVIVHRQYDPATFENDLALLELESPVQFDTHIVPICMPADTADFTGRMATVTGWGRLKYGGGVPSVLQEVQVPIIENSVCQEMFHTAGHNKRILNSFLCAGYANGQKDSCEGDSGGPLVLQRPDGRYELAGTVSHGIKCAAPYLPGVYMRTTYYKPWLRSITGIK